MSGTNSGQQPDADVQQIVSVLAEYENAYPNAAVEVRRRNRVSIRIRIIDPDFAGIDRGDREDQIWKILNQLPDELLADVTMLLLLTPDEVGRSFASAEFDDPIPSPL